MKLPSEIEMAVFETALQIDDARRRNEYLDWSFRGQPEERAKMEDLLCAEQESHGFFREATAAHDRVAGELITVGRVNLGGLDTDAVVSGGLGPRYTLIDRIGDGGGGVVYLADQLEPVRRRVAVKILRAGMDTPAVMAAFERERQALAAMSHPHIAHIYDAGTTADGRPFFVMELVEGEIITKFCNDRGYTIRQRLELFAQVCSAIQHAHQKGIIHRDIKPSNILVTSTDGQEMPKVIDFGIAFASSGTSLEDGTLPAGGTPAYMSPEQVEGNSDVDTRTDVFSLGVLLYELLAGPLPWAPGFMPMAGAARLPSDHVAGLHPAQRSLLAARCQLKPARLISALRGDLDSIIGKATATDRQQRYDMADSLAREINRHLANEPVLAHAPDKRYLLGKFARRHWGVVISVISVAAALLLGTGAAITAYLRECDALRQTEIARANEAVLRREAQARENVAKAAILVSQKQLEEADALLLATPLDGITPSLEAANVFRFLGERNALLGRWRQAADSFLKLMQANQLAPAEKTILTMDTLIAAPCLLEAGDEAAYDRLRRNMLDRYPATDHPVAAEHMIKMCLLRPAEPGMMRELRPMARVLEGGNEESTTKKAWNAMALALFHYRGGDFKLAVEWSRACLKLSESPASRTSAIKILLAMAHHRLGQPDDAQREFFSAARMIAEATPKVVVEEADQYRGESGTWYAWAVTRILQREAMAMPGAPWKAAAPPASR